MVWPFGESETPKQKVNRHKRAIQRAEREIGRERGRMKNDSKKIENDIKRLAKEGNQEALRIAAKNLVRNRQMQNRMMTSEANMASIRMQITKTAATVSMADSMKGVAGAMKQMNGMMNMPGMQKIMAQFQKESEVMEMKGEMMDDAMDMAFDDAEGEVDNEVDKVLSELGLQTLEQMGQAGAVPSSTPTTAAAVPQGPTPVAAGGGPSATVDEDDIMARLERLKDNK